MWVLGSVAFLLPAMVIAVQCLTRRTSTTSLQRRPKRLPVLAGQWLNLLSKFGLSGPRTEALSAILLFAAVGLVLSIALAFAPTEPDFDLLARQEAGDLTVSIYGPGHEPSPGKIVLGVLV